MPGRVDVYVDLVRRLIGSQFPHWAGLPVRRLVPGGWDNHSFRLGDDKVARLPAAACYSGQVAKERRWLPILAPSLPVPIPQPLTLGEPGQGYPWQWSVNSWIDGASVAQQPPGDMVRFARDLAAFLAKFHQVDARGGPAAGAHNFHRGGDLAHYDGETRAALVRLGGTIDTSRALTLWEAVLASRWQGPPLWVHGDVDAGNLLVRGGRLSGVIDFGSCGVGDPACDLAVAWTLFGPEARAAFRVALPLDRDTWTRGRGWAMWKALISLAAADGAAAADRHRATLAQVLSDEAPD